VGALWTTPGADPLLNRELQRGVRRPFPKEPRSADGKNEIKSLGNIDKCVHGGPGHIL